MRTRIIISGSRTASKKDFWAGIQACPFSFDDNIEIVNGAHTEGVDYWTVKWAKVMGYDIVLFPANWKKHGRKAGPLRNKKMAEYVTGYWPAPSRLFAIWDGKSSGTKNMIEIWKKYNLPYEVFLFEPET